MASHIILVLSTAEEYYLSSTKPNIYYLSTEVREDTANAFLTIYHIRISSVKIISREKSSPLSQSTNLST